MTPAEPTTHSDRKRPPDDALRLALDRHRRWVESGGRDGARADLTELDLSGCDLSGVCLASARLNGADLSLARLNGADLSGAYLVGAKLTRAELNLANLSTARLTDADLAGAALCRADLTGAYLERAGLSRADLSHATLTQADLARAELVGANLVRADLTRADLPRANLAGADLHRATLVRADLARADLSGANLVAADLSGARLPRADLRRADVRQANLSGAVLVGANLHKASLRAARLPDADLRAARVHRLDQAFVRGAQFSALAPRWRALLCEALFGPLSLWLGRRGWDRAAGWAAAFDAAPNDPWSVLRQSYAGPRVLFLFFTVVVFALPYVGRAAVYSAVGPVEQEVVRLLEARQRQLETRLAGFPPDPAARDELARIRELLGRVERKPVWKALLNWDRQGAWPTALAGLLILYNVGLYVLISRVSSLRDEEERSGWTPAWREYGHLVWVHRAVVVLFYVSFASFLYNVAGILNEEVFLPRWH